jgi:hypothetical protein
MEFPEGANMKPPRGYLPFWRLLYLSLNKANPVKQRQRVIALGYTKKDSSFADS